MACSSPLRLYQEDVRSGIVPNHADFKQSALRSSFGHNEFFTVPCRYCLNCRVDRQNEIVDRCEYEYINYGCGAFVSFTYDDYHNFKNGFIDSKDGQFKYSINKKDGKDFLNRLNKLVHQENKKTGYNPLCRKDYKYVITHEYGDKFQRNHIHCLFFGLDFAYCERLFWKAWDFQGSIQVGAIKDGGIAYCVKYISEQEYGLSKLFKYNYHHQTAPCSSHSLGLGSGLYKSQLKQIKESGTYHWHNTDRPVPSYWKNKFKVISDLQSDKMARKYKANCNKIYNLYEHKITSYKDFQNTNIEIARTRQRNLIEKLKQQGKQVYLPEYLEKEHYDMLYNVAYNRLKQNPSVIRVLNNDGTVYTKVNNDLKEHLTTRDLMLLHTDYYKLSKIYGIKEADKMCGLQPIPF